MYKDGRSFDDLLNYPFIHKIFEVLEMSVTTFLRSQAPNTLFSSENTEEIQQKEFRILLLHRFFVMQHGTPNCPFSLL